MKKLTTREEALSIINFVLIPKIVEEMNDLGVDNIKFKPQGCFGFKIDSEGNVYTDKRNRNENGENSNWSLRIKENDEDIRFGNNDNLIIKNIMIAFSCELRKLREDSRILKNAIKEVRGMGCLTDYYNKEIIIENKNNNEL
jgi:hypothetical protein